MQNASKGLVPQADLLLIDGNYFESNGIPYKTIIGGDRKCISIAAASILAKVSRDLWMIEVADKLYPEYGFSRHKGYGTKEHIMAIKHYGPCLLHRRTFLKKYLSEYFFQMSPGIENSLF
jgi:ribonuclease HII